MLTGCVASQSLYYWGDYSDTSYQYQKTPTAETMAAHIATLEKIIERSLDEGRRVAPGLAYELAMLEIERGSPSRGRQLLLLELTNYPESSVMVNRALSQLEE
mgnify:CR=1 FL=1